MNNTTSHHTVRLSLHTLLLLPARFSPHPRMSLHSLLQLTTASTLLTQWPRQLA